MITVYVVRNPNSESIRFSSIVRNEAVGFAQRVYNNTELICEIYEFERAPNDFRRG